MLGSVLLPVSCTEAVPDAPTVNTVDDRAFRQAGEIDVAPLAAVEIEEADTQQRAQIDLAVLVDGDVMAGIRSR